MLALPRHPIVYELNVGVWLNEVSARAGRRVTLASVPDAEWQRLAATGVHAVWLMGVWERSPSGRAIAHEDATLREALERTLPGFTARDVTGSPYCIRRYEVEPAFGGTAGLATARAQLARRGIALVLDFVPNHVNGRCPCSAA